MINFNRGGIASVGGEGPVKFSRVFGYARCGAGDLYFAWVAGRRRAREELAGDQNRANASDNSLWWLGQLTALETLEIDLLLVAVASVRVSSLKESLGKSWTTGRKVARRKQKAAERSLLGGPRGKDNNDGEPN